MVERTPDDMDLDEDRGDAAVRTHSYCAACLLGPWMAVSLLANALAVVDRYPPQRRWVA